MRRLLRDAASARDRGEHAQTASRYRLGGDEHIARGDRLRDSRQYEEAAEAYGEALKLLPLRTDIRIQQGNMLKDAGRLTEAETAYRSALASAPENAEIHLQLGHVFKLQGRRETALAAYRRAADLDPSLEAARVELFMAGCPQAQLQTFADQTARGGVEALLAVGSEVMRLRESVARLAAILPDLSSLTAFPIAAYDRFRALYDVPSPPAPVSDVGFGVVLSAIGMPLATLYDQLAALAAQTHRQLAGRRGRNRRGAAPGGRTRRGRRSRGSSGARLVKATQPRAPSTASPLTSRSIGWFCRRKARSCIGMRWPGTPPRSALAVRRPSSAIAEQAVIGADGRPEQLVPQLRQVVDYDTLLEANPFGGTIIGGTGRLCRGGWRSC